MGNSPVSGSSFIPVNVNNSDLRGEGTPPVTYVVLGPNDQFQSRQAPKKPGFFKKLFKWTAILGGVALGGLAFKSYLSGTLAEAATKTLTQVGTYVPGFIKAPFAAFNGSKATKTAVDWGKNKFNALKDQAPALIESVASSGLAQNALGQGGPFLNLLGKFFGKSG